MVGHPACLLGGLNPAWTSVIHHLPFLSLWTLSTKAEMCSAVSSESG